jgi:serine/threonine protein kinase
MKFSHPNVAHAYGVGEISISKTTKLPVIIREKFDSTLEDIITGGNQEVNVVGVISQAAQALAYLEENGVLVTDINPGNFGVREDKTIALFDINMSKNSGNGKVGGKGTFTAPELSVIGQKDEEKVHSASQRSQVYSLGSIAYAAMGGQDARDALAMGIDINKDTISSIPEKISNVLIKSLSRNPNDRYENPVKMAEALHEAFDSKGD